MVKLARGNREARQRFCAVPGYDSSEKKFLKVHAFKEHILDIFCVDLSADDPYVCSRLVKALDQAARWLLGR